MEIDEIIHTRKLVNKLNKLVKRYYEYRHQGNYGERYVGWEWSANNFCIVVIYEYLGPDDEWIEDDYEVAFCELEEFAKEYGF